MFMYEKQNYIDECNQRECEAVQKVLDIFDQPVFLTQTDVIRQACKLGVFFAVRKLALFLPVLVEEHNQKIMYHGS